MPHFDFIFPNRVHRDFESHCKSGQGISYIIFYSGDQTKDAFFKAFDEVMGIISLASHPGMSGVILTCHLFNY